MIINKYKVILNKEIFSNYDWLYLCTHIVEQQISPSLSSYHIITTKSDINNSKIYKIMLCLYDQRKNINNLVYF